MHEHGEVLDIAEGLPVPTVDIEVLEDPVSGWNLRIETTDFEVAPERASMEHVDGEGHMHLYINGEKITRLYSHWYHLGGLEPGEHEVRVDLSSNNHASLTVDGEVIRAYTTVVVADPGSGDSVSGDGSDTAVSGGSGHHGGADHHSDHHHSDGHSAAGGPTRFDADTADAEQTIAVEVAEGVVSGGYQRTEVALGSVVALHVVADTADSVHVHGYDIMSPVAPGGPAHFAFSADIPGVFEVELEDSGLLLLLLEIS